MTTSGYDGSIVINTKIQTDGFSAGLKKITGSAMRMGAAIREQMDLNKPLKSTNNALKTAALAVGAVFSVRAIQGFAQSAINEFSLMSSSFGQELKALQWNFIGLQGAIVNAIAPAFAAVFPYLMQAVTYFTQLFTRIAQISLAFFGVATATNAATLAQKQLNKAMGAGALGSFDQLNVLNAKPTLPSVEVPPDVQTKVDAFKTTALAALQPLFDAFDRLKVALTPLGQTIWAGLQWAWEKILQPIGTWVLNTAVPTFMDMVGAAGETLNKALVALKPLGDWLYETFLKPVGEWTGTAFLNAMDWMKQAFKDIGDWIDKNRGTFETIVIIIGSLAAGILIAAAAVWIGTAAMTAFGAVLAVVTSPIFLIGLAIGALIAIIVLLVKNWDWVKQAASDAWTWIQTAWSNVGAWFMTNVVNPMKAAFQPVLTWLSDTFGSTFEGIKGIVKSVVNTIIDFVNTMIRAIAGGINAIIGGLNSLHVEIPDWVPLIGGQSWGVSISPVVPPQIPRLATGAVIPANSAFLGILGDQRSGTNIEAPADLIRQIVREELNGSQGNQNITITFGGSMGELVRMLNPRIDQENTRIGGNLIQGVVTV
jgi:hypothetical protein